MSTIRDVAQKAGVAISTVSAVINRSAPTSAAVIARVEQAIAEIGYMPQRAAQTLRSGQSRLIGLIIPDIGNPHFSTVARVVENLCLDAGYMTFIYNTNEDADHEMQILRMMRMQRVSQSALWNNTTKSSPPTCPAKSRCGSHSATWPRKGRRAGSRLTRCRRQVSACCRRPAGLTRPGSGQSADCSVIFPPRALRSS